MTYRELRDKLDELTDEQLDCDVTVHDLDDEYFPISSLETYDTEGVLDDNHPFLEVQ